MQTPYFEQLGDAYLAHFCRRLADLIIEQGSGMLQEMGLKTPTTAISALIYLSEHQEVTVAQLAESLGVTHQMGTQRVNLLEKLGLITRTDSLVDKRAKQIILTSLGQSEVEQLLPFTEKFNRVFKSINEEMGCNLSQLIRKTEVALQNDPLKDRFKRLSDK
ncbi:MarR family transcriptional regulator [Aliikangiella marina]|uniref:MarR family transcriptional regulator n=1 Tax=Aliikangiella marina TaxID=1712262 RepID=A0A545T6G6_9GAMM|nr:MarR family transcriptional regulator [Aliikangiella marina]TQV72775.1 MarR family transcriptional regulator [Aliikangiella marina]